MKKILAFLFTTVFLSSASYGQADCLQNSCWNDNGASLLCCQNTCCDQFSVEAQYAAFFPLDSKVRRIYKSALPSFTLEGNWQCQCWGLWLNGSYVFGNGHAIGCGRNKTHLNLVPITFGVKYIYSVCDSASLYLGLGASYSFLNIRDHSDFVHKKVSSNGFGGVIKTGFVYNYCENIFLEGFLNYLYQRFTFPKTGSDPFVYRQDANLSALQLGIGLGMKF
jgi:hypothetical protein